MYRYIFLFFPLFLLACQQVEPIVVPGPPEQEIDKGPARPRSSHTACASSPDMRASIRQIDMAYLIATNPKIRTRMN